MKPLDRRVAMPWTLQPIGDDLIAPVADSMGHGHHGRAVGRVRHVSSSDLGVNRGEFWDLVQILHQHLRGAGLIGGVVVQELLLGERFDALENVGANLAGHVLNEVEPGDLCPRDDLAAQDEVVQRPTIRRNSGDECLSGRFSRHGLPPFGWPRPHQRIGRPVLPLVAGVAPC